MAQVKFYFFNENWWYSDGVSEAIHRVPPAKYESEELGEYVSIKVIDASEKYLFKDIQVTDIQKSPTPDDNYTDLAEFQTATTNFFVDASVAGGEVDPVYLDNEIPKYSDTEGSLTGSGIISTDDNTDFDTRSITAKKYNLLTNNCIESSTNSIILRDLTSDEIFYNSKTSYSSNVEKAKLLKTQVRDEVIQAVNTETISNPRWAYSVTEDHILESIQIDSVGFFLDVTLIAYRNSVEIWRSEPIGLFGGVERVFDIVNGTSLETPLEFKNDGGSYELELSSTGFLGVDVYGDTFDVPYYTVSYSKYVNRPVQSLPDSTGVVEGLDVSLSVTADTVDITTGYGYIISDDGNNIQYIEIPENTDFLVSVVTDGNFGLAINNSGNFVQTAANNVTAQFIRDNLLIGFLEIESGSLTQADTYQLQTNTTYSQFMDLFEVLGSIAGQGLDTSPQANLSFDISAGFLGFRGSGTSQANRTPNVLTLDARVTTEFDRFVGINGAITAFNQTTIDPGNYDDGTATPAAIPAIENATIQYIYQLPFPNGGVSVMYGQTVYPTLEDAIVNKDNDVLTLPLEISTNALLLARIALRADTTDLSDDAQAVFLPGAKFGAQIKGGAVGSGGPGGGDMFGAASSTLNEIVTYADATGKIASSNSDITADAGRIQRIAANGTLFVRGGASLPQLTINPALLTISLATNGPVFTVIEADNGATLTGLGGSSAAHVVRSDNPQFAFKNQAGTDIGRFEYNKSSDGFIAIRFDGGATIALDGDEIRHDIGTTSWRQTATGIVWDTDTNPAIHTLRSDTVSYLITNAAGTPQGFFSFSSINDYVTVGRSSGAEVQVKTTGVNIISNTGELTVDDIPVVLDNVGRTVLTPGAIVDVDFVKYEEIYTLAASQNTTLTFSNLEVGHSVQLEFTGNFTLTFPSEAKKLSSSGDIAGTGTNIIYMYVSDTNIVDYTIQQRGT